MCTERCLISIVFSGKVLSHLGHFRLDLSWCFSSMCLFRFSTRPNVLPQVGHAQWLTFVWTVRWCLSKASFWVKLLSHWWQACLIFWWTDCSCFTKKAFCTKALSHVLHWNRLALFVSGLALSFPHHINPFLLVYCLTWFSKPTGSP